MMNPPLQEERRKIPPDSIKLYSINKIKESCLLELDSLRMQASPQTLSTILPTSGPPCTSISRLVTLWEVCGVLSEWLGFLNSKGKTYDVTGLFGAI